MLITSGLSSVLLRGECKAGKVLRLNISDKKQESTKIWTSQARRQTVSNYSC